MKVGASASAAQQQGWDTLCVTHRGTVTHGPVAHQPPADRDKVL